LLQIVFDSLTRAAELSLMAVGLTMVYSLLRFPNFAHVESATIGAYAALFFSTTLGLAFLPAAVLAILLTAVLGVVFDKLVFGHLRDRSDIILMIASFALGIGIRQVFLLFWGPRPHFFSVGWGSALSIGGAHITPVQIGVIVTAVVCMLLFHLLLNRTRMGIAMRASADNSVLAEASGIRTERIVTAVWLLGSGMAGVAGVLLALDTQIQPNMGVAVIIPVFGAAIMGRIGNPYGAMAGALIFGFAENFGLGINWAPLLQTVGLTSADFAFIPAGYKEAVPFAVLIVVLIWRPQGLFGRVTR